MQGRYRDAYEVAKPTDNNPDEPTMEFDEQPFQYEAEEAEEEESLEDQLRAAESLPMPYRIVRRATLLANAAVDVVEDDPEQALERIGMAQEELDALAPGQTMHLTRALGVLRARAVANLGGLPKQIEFEEQRLADFIKAHGCSAEMTRQFLVRDLAGLHIQNASYQIAKELLRDIKGFLELRGGKETLLYGSTLVALAGIADDVQEAEQLRAQGMEIIDSLRDQTEFD
jgi:hypothetical protein